MSLTPPLVIVSKSEPAEAVLKLTSFGLNAVAGEAGTDYVWYPHGQVWGIERKRIDNLLGSLKDRQLVEQTHRGSDQFDRYIILIEGDFRRNANGMLAFHLPSHPAASRDGWVESGWQYAAISGMLFDLQLIGSNITITQWPVLYDSAAAIARIVSATSGDDHKFIRERQRPDLPANAAMGGPLYADALWALMALPGVGPNVAQALLDHFGTLANVVAAMVREKPSVANVKCNGKKLGAKLADKCYNAVTATF